jgi:Di-haem cytochrome c peroxidase
MDFQIRRPGVAGAFSIASALLIVMTTERIVADRDVVVQAGPMSIPLDCDAAALPRPESDQCRMRRRLEGQRLFEQETFGGNGRTCLTCHSVETGTISPSDVQQRLVRNPLDVLFLHDGLDDGIAGTSRIEQHATVRITLPLPAHLRLANDPGATEITFNRAVLTTLNAPALDRALMWDLRAANLEVQALGAIHGHAQNAIEPTPLQLELIAEFQRTSPRFFSNGHLRKFAETGVPPPLPEGTTESERRGRLFFIDAPLEPPAKVGLCALCHSGPMLNVTNIFSTRVFGSPPGAGMNDVGVSEANFIGNPTYTFLVFDELGPPVPVTTPDIGVLMTDPATSPVLAEVLPSTEVLRRFGLRLASFANFFKTPSLWNVKNTAPYFHDNSAKDLDEMLRQYDFVFKNGTLRGRVELTPQDKEDIKAFLKLL